MHGSVTAGNTDGGGLCVTLTLPLAKEDEDIAAIERDYLTLSGYEVAICPDSPSGLQAADTLTVGPLTAEPEARRILKNGAELPLKNREYELLLFLMRHPGQVFSREDLYELIWGLESMGDNITVAVHIGRIRDKIEDDPANPRLLQTVWGVGYRLNP